MNISLLDIDCFKILSGIGLLPRSILKVDSFTNSSYHVCI